MVHEWGMNNIALASTDVIITYPLSFITASPIPKVLASPLYPMLYRVDPTDTNSFRVQVSVANRLIYWRAYGS